MQFEDLLVGGMSFKTIFPAKYKNRKSWSPPDNRKVSAFLPGTITQILVEKGEQVKAGQTVVKFEAMKMINNIQALTSGKVKEIYVKEGDKFSKGFVLMELE